MMCCINRKIIQMLGFIFNFNLKYLRKINNIIIYNLMLKYFLDIFK